MVAPRRPAVTSPRGRFAAPAACATPTRKHSCPREAPPPMESPPSPPPPPPSLDQRRAALEAAIQDAARAGWRVESRSDTQATIAKGKRPSHVLHLLLSIITLGIWLIVWLVVLLFGGEKRRLITVSEDGSIKRQRS